MTETTIDIRPGNIVKTSRTPYVSASRRRLEVFVNGIFRGHFLYEGGDGYVLHKADGSYASCPLPYAEWSKRRTHETLLRAGHQTYATKNRADLLRLACVAHGDDALPSLAAIQRATAQAQQAELAAGLAAATAGLLGKYPKELITILRMLENHGKIYSAEERPSRDFARTFFAELDKINALLIDQHNERYTPRAEG